MSSSSFFLDKTRLSREFPSTEAFLAASSSKSRELIHRESASEVAQSIYDKNLSRSELLNSNKLAEIPRFAMQEIFEGLVLGSGCFASVYEVRGFSITEDDGQRLSLSRDDDEVNPGEIESRKFIAKHCYRSNGDARYAIKRLRQATICESLSYMNGMADLATETLFLASLQHPNIIKLRGIAKEDMFSEEYYLILDRLYDTLTVRVRKWKKRKKQSQGIMGSFKDRDGSAKKQLFEERMQYGLDLAAAIAYIHKQMIIHRDLKSENIGFDVRGDIKVFDFGLAKEIPRQENGFGDETYLFTATTGTPRYMAPEVALGQQYNQSCDIYSFGLVFWEMMNLKRPFLDQKSLDHFQENVWENSGPQVRPSVPKRLPSNIQKLLEQSWHSNLKVRPSASQFENALRVECLILRKDMRVSHNARRSTYLLVRGKGETINQSARSIQSHSAYDNEEYSTGFSESQL